MFEFLHRKTTGFFRNAFHSLVHRNFRYFWTGQCVSLIGTFMQRTAQYWLVYTLTKSPLLVGLLGVCQFLPMLLFSLFAGVIIDRFPKKQLLMVTQSLFLLQAIALTALTFTGQIQYWHILVLSAVYGVTQTIDMPARQAFVFELVGKDDIMNAISLNSTAINGAKIVGPAIAGILMLHLGIVLCFFINALSYIAVLGGLFMVKAEPKVLERAGRRMLSEIVDGLKYIKNSEPLVIDVLIFGIVSTFAMNNDVIIPVFAKTVLNMGADGYSLLLTAAGVGSLIGALTMASISNGGVRKNLLVLGAVSTAALQIATVLTASYIVSLVLIAVIGFINLVFFNTANALFQVYATDEYRGRVMSVYSLLAQGSTPIGNFFAGTVMEHIGGDSGFVSCGVVTLLLLVPVFFIKRKMIAEWVSNGGRLLAGSK
jgi:MFS family permease